MVAVKNVKAVILLGGPQKGTRFRPLSLECPKPLFPIAGCPTIQHHIESLAQVVDVTEILLIGFYAQSEMSPFLVQMQRVYPQINLRYLQEFTSMGTAGGIYHFRDQILQGHPSLILCINGDVCGDIPYSALLARAAERPQAAVTILATEATREQSIHFGCCVIDEKSNEVQHYVNKPSTYISTNISCGIYVLTEHCFPYLADAYAKRVASGAHELGNDPLHGHGDAAEALWFEDDILPQLAGTKSFYAHRTQKWWSQIKNAAAALYANRHHLALYAESADPKQRERITTADGPDAPTIIGQVHIHPSASVDPSATIGPNVSIGRNCTIRAGARIRESIILDGANIDEHACVLHSIVGWNSTVGPWARIEGTPSNPNPNIAFAKLENRPLFNQDGRLNPAITILGCGVQVPPETILLNSIVLPHKEIRGNYQNQIIL